MSSDARCHRYLIRTGPRVAGVPTNATHDAVGLGVRPHHHPHLCSAGHRENNARVGLGSQPTGSLRGLVQHGPAGKRPPRHVRRSHGASRTAGTTCRRAPHCERRAVLPSPRDWPDRPLAVRTSSSCSTMLTRSPIDRCGTTSTDSRSHRPAWLHWIIVTRADPPLGVQRLQLQGRLAQVRVTDLAFDVEEATAFMAWFGLDIPSDAVRGLVRWSEGWVAALCLAARTMLSEGVETRPWERLGASESLVVDFLIEEVLDRLSPADRRFLLRTSAADLLTPELAALLTGNTMAGERLHRLERAGTFLLQVDSSGKNYRYHGMMAALLRARLNDQMPSEARNLVSTAARWYCEHGYLDEAERHALRIGDWDLVGQLRAKRCGDHLIRTGSLLAMLGSPPSGAATAEPALQLLATVEVLRQRDRGTTERALTEGSQAIDVSESTPAVQLLRELLLVEQSRWMPTPSGPVTTRADAPPHAARRGPPGARRAQLVPPGARGRIVPRRMSGRRRATLLRRGRGVARRAGMGSP